LKYSYQNYDPRLPETTPSRPAAGWSIPFDEDYGFVPSSSFTTLDIICHKGATPGQVTIPINAGDSLSLQWSPAPWTSGHHGPVLDYLAPCNGPCSIVNKTELKFFKIAEAGIIAPAPFPAYYASDLLRDNNSSWTVFIPTTLKSGEYVLRHEIIALHLAWNEGDAQAYPQCINLNVTGSGNKEQAGVSAQALYGAKDEGILIDIWQFNGTYVIPGPKVWEGATGYAQPSVPILSEKEMNTSPS
jgi:cellulase